MSKNETFQGLDKMILDQPEFIDLNDSDEKTDEVIAEEKSVKELEESEKKKVVDKSKTKVDDNLLEIEEVGEDEEEEEEATPPGAKTQEELLKGWGDYFKENTILSEEDLDGFDGTAEGLTKAFQAREVRVGLEMVDDYKSQLPDMLKYLADNWEEGVPLTELLNIKSNQIRYSNITDEKLEESVDTQKAVYTEYLRKTTKYSDTKIEKEVARLVDLDELKDETKDALKELKKGELEAEDTIRRETKKEQDFRKEENKKQIAHYEKIAKTTKEIIPGLKIDEKAQEDILKKVINPIGIDGNGNQVSYIQSIRNEDPYNFDIKLNYLMVLTKGLTDFSKITNTATTKATKDLTKILQSPAPKGKDGINTDGKKNILDYLAMPQNKNK